MVELLTMHLGPAEILLAMTLDFHDGLSRGDVQAAVDDLTEQLRREHPEITRIFLRPSPPVSPNPNVQRGVAAAAAPGDPKQR